MTAEPSAENPRSWAAQRAARQDRKPVHDRWHRWTNLEAKQARRAERKAEAKAKREALRGNGCPHSLTTWDTVPHHRYPDRPALAHRVPVRVQCTRMEMHSWHLAPGHRWTGRRAPLTLVD